MFHDRIEAGQRLAQALQHYRGRQPLVLAIPRGAVPMGRVIAEALGGEFDVVMVRKLGAPGYPEYALAAVDESGWVYRNPEAGDDAQTLAYLARERERQLAVMRERRAQYTPGRAPLAAAGRIVIVVDDGLATGSTMIAALHALRARQPAELVCAVPVAPPETVERLRPYADTVICLETPPYFQAVGQFYDDFSQVEDAEVIAVLNAAAQSRAQPVCIALDGIVLEGELTPGRTGQWVIFAHGSGSSRHSPRNRYVAQVLNAAGIGTLLFDMLSEDEDRDYARRFDIELLTARLLAVNAWLRAQPEGSRAALGYFGASTGAAAALRAAATAQPPISAVVSRGGRPDLAGEAALAQVRCPTLLIVGGDDTEVLALNRRALTVLGGEKRLEEIPGASHLFEEAGTLEQAAASASRWFAQHLKADVEA